MSGRRILLGAVLAVLAAPGVAHAGSANPSSIGFGNVPINTTVTRDVTITVDPGFRTEVASGSGLNAPFAFDFDTCGTGGGFAGPGTCNVKEKFTPTALAVSSGTTNVFECPIVGGTCIAIPYTESGTGVSVASATPSAVSFGNVPLNTTAIRNVSVSVDTGYRTEVASGSGLNAPFAFDFDTCGTGGGFAGPGTCNVKEKFTPTALSTSSGTTNVFECPVAGGTCVAIRYTESGTGVSVASATPSAVAFGGVPINTMATRNVSISVDTGYRTEVASGSGLNAPFAFDFDTCGTGGGFAGPGTCNVKEKFTPTALTASNGTTNVFECPIVGGTCIAIPYTESGTGVSVASATPSAVSFGNVPLNTTAIRNVSVSVDTGYRTEVASGSGLNAPFAFDFDTCGTGGGFAGPGTCNVKEKFTPTALTPSSGTTNVFECPIVGGTCIAIPYTESGTGVSLASATPSAVSFGDVPINTTATQNASIQVDTGYRVSVASGSGLNAPFAFDFDSCGTGGGFSGPGTCNVKEKFTPTALAVSSGITNVFECPIVGGTCIAIPYTESGTGVSVRAASPTSVVFGTVPINTTATQSVSIQVDTGYRVSVASGSGLNAPFAFDFDTCGTGGGFAGPGMCSVKEKFTPTTLSASNGTTNVFECPIVGGTCLAITYTDQGAGVTGGAANPSLVDFGNVRTGTSANRTVTLTIDAGFRYSGATGTGTAAPFGFAGGACAVADGFAGPGTCTVSESFSPTGLGDASGTTAASECPVGGGTCVPIPFDVKGTGVSATGGTNPQSVDFGSVALNTTSSRDVSLTLDDGYAFSAATGSGATAPFGFLPSTCTSFTGPGTCTFKQTFAPSALGAASGSTTVSECPVAGGSCIPFTLPVQGSGVSALAVNPATLAFGSVPLGSNARLNVDVTLDAGYGFGTAGGSGTAAPFAFESRTCGTGPFTGPGTCQVRETFAPTSVGAASGTLALSECPVAGGACIPISVSLQGVGDSGASATPSSLDFGDVNVGGSAKQTIKISVDGGYTIPGGSGSGTAAPFTLDLKTCASFTGPGNCTVAESFSPASAGPASGTLTITECPVGGGTCIPIPIPLAGNGVRIATSLGLTSNRNPAHPGQSVTFTATVTPASGTNPTGTVTFTDGSVVLGTITLSGKKAILATSSLTLGAHTITATYAGDTAYTGGTNTLTQTIN